MGFHVEAATEPDTIHLDRKVTSNLSVKGPLITGLTAAILELGLLDEDSLEQLELCLDEALTNSMIHGNKSDPKLHVRVRLFQNENEWGVEIEDEGDGFSVDQIPDPSAPDFPWREDGRGIHMMRHYASRVEFFNEGRTVVMAWDLPTS